ncbi:hypothetical protein WJX74_004506 [Apatococcus lobatus]|uniref:Uncharacterized protein n=1 Tax=Apatococcus lobatus TaxID=904363 RepID=A0AAW1QLI1_9CHLO
MSSFLRAATRLSRQACLTGGRNNHNKAQQQQQSPQPARHPCDTRRSPAAFRTASSAAGIPAALSHVAAMQSRLMFSCLDDDT